MDLKQCLPVALFAALLLLPAQGGFAQNLLNVNTATVEELSAVPGLNEFIAQKIVEYREDMGDFQTLDELAEIEGLNSDMVGKLKEYIGLDAISGAECSC